MIITTTLILFTLVTINLLLLKFSSNKVIKTKSIGQKPVILHPQVTFSNANKKENLAPTGS